jgi:uncharacterized protein YdhG (YjbR/CyaY superfamily)
MIYASTDKEHCAFSPSRAVRPVADIVCEPYGPIRLTVRLVQVANINTVLTEELVQFQLPSANTISVSTSQPQGPPSFVLGRTAILSFEEDHGL